MKTPSLTCLLPEMGRLHGWAKMRLSTELSTCGLSMRLGLIHSMEVPG